MCWRAVQANRTSRGLLRPGKVLVCVANPLQVIFPLTCCIMSWPFMSGVPVRTIANTMALVQVASHPPLGKPRRNYQLGRTATHSSRYTLWFIYLGLNGLPGLDSVNALLALMTRRKYWGRWEFLTNLPIPQLDVIIFINFTETAALVIFIVLAEFANADYVILEFILPKWTWLASCLAKYDKRRLPLQTKNTLEKSEIESSVELNKDSSLLLALIWSLLCEKTVS